MIDCVNANDRMRRCANIKSCCLRSLRTVTMMGSIDYAHYIERGGDVSLPLGRMMGGGKRQAVV